ncbi:MULTISPECIES: hypothetical protein [Polaromonas]|uniref:Uncharacterized protein n=1 Tax=Polaromonas aquatica TaxID=332657 RepID=A0ABW1U011_9BURK
MNDKSLLPKVAALLIAWAIVLLGAGLIDAWFGTALQPFISVWLFAEFLVILHKKIPLPSINTGNIDMAFAFTSLWRAASWPRYFFSNQ